MKKKKFNILNDILKKKKFLKNEIKKIILKNNIYSENINYEIRMLSKLKLQKIKKKSCLSYQNNNICLKTGKIKSVYKITNLDRHYMKKIAMNNNLQNFRIQNW